MTERERVREIDRPREMNSKVNVSKLQALVMALPDRGSKTLLM